MRGGIDLFSIGMLLDMMERAGFRIYQKIEIDACNFLGKYRHSRQIGMTTKK